MASSSIDVCGRGGADRSGTVALAALVLARRAGRTAVISALADA